jgi:alcohol dehydrogenase class IV
MNSFNFMFPTEMLIGVGRRKELGRIAIKYGKKAFLVFDPFLQNSETLNELIETLQEEGIGLETYHDIVPNPRYTAIDYGIEQCKKAGADFVIGIGGGSAIDTAKAIAFVTVHGGSCWEYTERRGEDVKRPQMRGLPFIAIPTTAGTGTEATQVSVINNPDEGRKCSIVNPAIYPQVAIVDPELMLSLPKELTALTGIDTFAHALEAYICNGNNPFSDAFALHAMELFAKSIRNAVNRKDDLGARYAMSLSCALAGAAFSNAGVCLPHAMGQPLSAFTDAPHGGTLAACMPQVVTWTIPFSQDRLARVANILDSDTVKGKTVKEKAESLPGILCKLYRDLDVHVSFANYGLKEEDVDDFVDLCFVAYKQDIDNHPKLVAKGDVRELVLQCMKGLE